MRLCTTRPLGDTHLDGRTAASAPGTAPNLHPVQSQARDSSGEHRTLGRSRAPRPPCSPLAASPAPADLPVPRTRLSMAPPPPWLRWPASPGPLPRTRRSPVASHRYMHGLRPGHPRRFGRPRDRPQQLSIWPLSPSAPPLYGHAPRWGRADAGVRHVELPCRLAPARPQRGGPSSGPSVHTALSELRPCSSATRSDPRSGSSRTAPPLGGARGRRLALPGFRFRRLARRPPPWHPW